MSPASKAKIAANAKYDDKAYDKFLVRVPKGQKSSIQAHAEGRSESLNGFVTRAINETIERDNATQAETE